MNLQNQEIIEQHREEIKELGGDLDLFVKQNKIKFLSESLAIELLEAYLEDLHYSNEASGRL